MDTSRWIGEALIRLQGVGRISGSQNILNTRWAFVTNQVYPISMPYCKVGLAFAFVLMQVLSGLYDAPCHLTICFWLTLNGERRENQQIDSVLFEIMFFCGYHAWLPSHKALYCTACFHVHEPTTQSIPNYAAIFISIPFNCKYSQITNKRLRSFVDLVKKADL